MPGSLPFGEVEGGFDLIEGEPFEFGDFVGLLGWGFGRVFQRGEEEDDGFEDV